eukprot:1147157-Pelagomonas_calceolata.AAC.2
MPAHPRSRGTRLQAGLGSLKSMEAQLEEAAIPQKVPNSNSSQKVQQPAAPVPVALYAQNRDMKLFQRASLCSPPA